MDAIAAGIIDFISANRGLAFWAMFLLNTAEATALVSIFVPATSIVVACGALVALGALDFLPIWAGAALGSVAGSSLSWWLGRRFGARILGIWPLSRHPEFLGRGLEMLRRRGASAILLGHFVGPLRPIVFLASGMAHLPLPVFLAWTSGGAAVWAFLFVKAGELGWDLLGWLWQEAATL